jgi:transcriptional regulator of acetoin/glycerol metabolism
MNRHDVRESLVERGDEFEFEMDLQVAARSEAPVLISGSPRCALMLAQAIAGRLARADHSIRILTCDVTDCDDLGAAVAALEAGESHSPRASILLLREVHALTQAGQSGLRRLMVERPLEASRVFASSSVSLFQRVKDGLFDAELFYHLNTIHIVTSEPQHDSRRG